jgi:hypothetical protein
MGRGVRGEVGWKEVWEDVRDRRDEAVAWVPPLLLVDSREASMLERRRLRRLRDGVVGEVGMLSPVCD